MRLKHSVSDKLLHELAQSPLGGGIQLVFERTHTTTLKVFEGAFPLGSSLCFVGLKDQTRKLRKVTDLRVHHVKKCSCTCQCTSVAEPMNRTYDNILPGLPKEERLLVKLLCVLQHCATGQQHAWLY